MAAFYFPKLNCVFIHIPKTGGASIRHGAFGGAYEHPPYHGVIPTHLLEKFSFAFVRNPFDRLISGWRMFAQGMENTVWEYPKDAERELTLSRFLDIAVDERIIYDQNRRTFHEKLRHHAIPQTHEFNLLKHADFIGRFETYEHDFKTICSKIGIPPPVLPHHNISARGHYRDYFDDETRRRAEAYYAEDLKQFGYEF